MADGAKRQSAARMRCGGGPRSTRRVRTFLLCAAGLLLGSCSAETLRCVRMNEWLALHEQVLDATAAQDRPYDVHLPQGTFADGRPPVHVDLSNEVTSTMSTHGWWPYSDRNAAGEGTLRLWYGGTSVLQMPPGEPGEPAWYRSDLEQLLERILIRNGIPYRWEIGGGLELVVPKCFAGHARTTLRNVARVRGFVTEG